MIPMGILGMVPFDQAVGGMLAFILSLALPATGSGVVGLF